MKPFSQACENNKVAILEVLQRWFRDSKYVFEIGSGTGQHAVYFAANQPDLFWQTSDRKTNHSGMNQWLDEYHGGNIGYPINLDVDIEDHWNDLFRLSSRQAYDGVFTANTAHIMSWPIVEKMFPGVGRLLSEGGLFLVYGPFNRNGEFTSPGNQCFHQYLQEQDPCMGIRDDQDIITLARQHSMLLMEDVSMPANNRILVFKKINE